ncbi:MAG: hypothetical protein HQM08_17965 [Candidatus Riflebacteria bacterium]|nr:hypothetical protein [Candidatus Riflebacteria bacterium]
MKRIFSFFILLIVFRMRVTSESFIEAGFLVLRIVRLPSPLLPDGYD